jgi:hypothetical protein
MRFVSEACPIPKTKAILLCSFWVNRLWLAGLEKFETSSRKQELSRAFAGPGFISPILQRWSPFWSRWV